MNGRQAMNAAHELDARLRKSGGDPRFVDLDGRDISHDEWRWDYDLRAVRVDFTSTRFGRYWDGWFATRYADGSRGSVMNASRLWTFHPSTGERADTT